MYVYVHMHHMYMYRYGLPHPEVAPNILECVWQRLPKCKTLVIALHVTLTTSEEDVNIQLERFCMGCKLSMERTISAITERVVFQWQKHTDLERKVHYWYC